MDSTNVPSVRNSLGADDQHGTLQLDATLLDGSNPDDDRIISSNPQYAGDDGSRSAGDDGFVQGYEEY